MRIWRAGDLLLPLRATSSCHRCRSRAGWRDRQVLSGCKSTLITPLSHIKANTFATGSAPLLRTAASAQITASQLLRQCDDGYPVRSCRMGADNEHRVQWLAFEILRRFIAVPHDYEAIGRAKGDPFELGRLVLALEALPSLNRMQPFTGTQLAQAVGLARFLVCNADSIPDERRVPVRRLAVVPA